MGRSSPTLNIVVVTVAVYALQAVWFSPAELALVWPVGERPWTLVTSVFAHSTLPHLVSNLLALAVIGLLLERQTSPARFYAFFLTTGALSGIAEVAVAAALGAAFPAVVGASGAIFAMLGYLLSSNRLADRTFRGVAIPARAQLALFLVVAAVVTVFTLGQGRNVAIVAHFSGLLVGLLAGRSHLLRTSRAEPTPY